MSLSVLGISTPIAALPGIGEMIRTSALLTARAMFLVSAVMRSTFTAGPSSISYRVIVGPRVKPVTCASMPNWSSTSVRAFTTMSLALVRGLTIEPAFSTVAFGSRYVPSPVPLVDSVSCSVIFGGGVGSGGAGAYAGSAGSSSSSARLGAPSSSNSTSPGTPGTATTGVS